MHLDISKIKLYAIQDKNGRWFKSRGTAGYGERWVDNIQDARFYQNIGAARSIITYFSKFGIFDLIQFNIGSAELLDEKDRVLKQKSAKEKKKLIYDEQLKKLAFERAEKELVMAKDKLEKLTNGK